MQAPQMPRRWRLRSVSRNVEKLVKHDQTIREYFVQQDDESRRCMYSSEYMYFMLLAS